MKTILMAALLFHYGDIVVYKVPEFYKNVCSSKGKVIGYNKDGKGIKYVVENLEHDCPAEVIVGEYQEYDLKPYKIKKR